MKPEAESPALGTWGGGGERKKRKETHKAALKGLQRPRQGLLLQVGL